MKNAPARVAAWYRRLVESRAADRPKKFPADGEQSTTPRYVAEFCRMNGLKHGERQS